MSIKFISLGTIETEIAKTQDSGSVGDNRDFEIVGWISFKDFINMTLVLQADVKTFRVDIYM
jgi:hypothetical protein